MKSIIFLDIDGVLSLIPQWNLHRTSKSWIKEYDIYPFDKKCVEVLNTILKETDAEIVISSDWRIEFKFNELKNIFKINNVIKQPIDITPEFITSAQYLEKNRAAEILEYIDNYKISSYIVIDDLDMSKWFDENNFIQCPNSMEGIKQTGIKNKIIKKLKNETTF